MESQQERGRACVPYPLFVKIEGARVVIVGAGSVAVRKAVSLVQHGALVTVIAPDADERIARLAHEGAIEWLERPYMHGDLAGARLAFAATSSREVNAAVCAEADEEGVLVNVVDDPQMCTCTVPAVMRRGQLQVAVSTNGAAPGLARDIRNELEAAYPDWWEDYVDVLSDVRELVKARVAGDTARRTPLFEAVSHAGLAERFAVGEKLEAEQVYDEVVAPIIKGGGA